MKTKIAILLLVLPLMLLGQDLLDCPESITYDSAQSRYLVTNVGSGDIIAIDDQGVQSTFVTGQSKRGILLKDDYVYTAGDAGVTCFDLDGSQVWQTSLPSAIFPNDIAADNSGFLYISDNASSKIFKVEIATQDAEVFVNGGISGPNGMYFDESNNRLIAVCWMNNAHVKAIDLDTATVTTIITTNYNSLDGITRDSAGNFYISSWGTNSVYKYAPDFSGIPEVFSSGHDGPADIYFDSVNNILAVPNFDANTVDFLDMPVSADNEGILSVPILNQNYPNPFNPSTTISFSISRHGAKNAKIDICNVKGQNVKTLPIYSSTHSPINSVTWNGDDANGKPVSSGVYYYKLILDNDVLASKKMILIK